MKLAWLVHNQFDDWERCGREEALKAMPTEYENRFVLHNGFNLD